jgi:hypothetical protein
MLALATSVARPNLVSLGTCFGKFSKSGKFKLGVTALDWLATYAKYKVSWRGEDVMSGRTRQRVSGGRRGRRGCNGRLSGWRKRRVTGGQRDLVLVSCQRATLLLCLAQRDLLAASSIANLPPRPCRNLITQGARLTRRSGSNPPESSLSCTATTSSKPIWAE